MNASSRNDNSLRRDARSRRHHLGKGFRHAFGREGFGSLKDILKWKLLSPNPYRRAYAAERTVPVKVDWQAVENHGGLSLTYIKHAGIYIRDHGCGILIDPVFFGLGPFIHDYSPLEFSPEDLPPVDYVLITHGHYDHLDKRTLRYFRKAHFITPLGYQRILKSLRPQVHSELDWYETQTAGNRRITLLPSRHWTMRNPVSGPNRALWGSYMIETAGGKNIFILGDSAYFDGLADIGAEFKIDLAVFNLSAYEPRWFMRHAHMNPQEAVRAFKLLGAQKMMIAHWGTFRLGNEPVNLPPLEIARAMAAAGLQERLLHLDHGQSFFWDY